ncbi:hypothetical protein CW304_08355 [Bacillus sp. UFRGS-B20]|nr:hypothetical protein CW304_08355 [Bacillus sp. UFRGS-B20]
MCYHHFVFASLFRFYQQHYKQKAQLTFHQAGKLLQLLSLLHHTCTPSDKLLLTIAGNPSGTSPQQLANAS